MKYTTLATLVSISTTVLVGCAAGQVEAECPEPAREQVETAAKLDMTKTLDGVTDMETAVSRVKEALEAQGFGVVSQMDVQAVMNDRLGEDIRPYRILGACNPALALRALEQNEAAGLLLPCKAVVFQDEDGAFAVTLGRPTALFGLLNDPATDPLAEEVEKKLTTVFDSL